MSRYTTIFVLQIDRPIDHQMYKSIVLVEHRAVGSGEQYEYIVYIKYMLMTLNSEILRYFCMYIVMNRIWVKPATPFECTISKTFLTIHTLATGNKYTCRKKNHSKLERKQQNNNPSSIVDSYGAALSPD